MSPNAELLCQAVDWDEVLSCIAHMRHEWYGCGDTSDLDDLYDAVDAIKAHVDGSGAGQ